MTVVARDTSNASHIIFPWPEPVPWGAEVVCADSEIAIICPNWEVGEALGPGRHTVSPPNPQSNVLAYFVTTAPRPVMFDQSIAVMDGTTGKPVAVRFSGSAQIKIGDPLLMCHQIVGLPYHDLSTGIVRSAELSLCRAFQQVIVKMVTAHATAMALASAEAVAQLVGVAVAANPMSVAVAGLELVRMERFGVSISGAEPILWKAAILSGADDAEQEAMDRELDAMLQGEAHLGPGAPPAPAQPGGTSPGVTSPGGYDPRQSSPHLTRQSSPHMVRQSSPHLAPPAAAPAPQRRRTPPLGMPAALPQSGEAPLPAGSHVLVFWNDGLWHAAVIRAFEGGRYQVSVDGAETLAWVQANQVRPA